MPAQVIVPDSLRMGEYLTVLLGFGLSTFAICARIYTKSRITKKFLLEDCELFSGRVRESMSSLLKQARFLLRWLRTSSVEVFLFWRLWKR